MSVASIFDIQFAWFISSTSRIMDVCESCVFLSSHAQRIAPFKLVHLAAYILHSCVTAPINRSRTLLTILFLWPQCGYVGSNWTVLYVEWSTSNDFENCVAQCILRYYRHCAVQIWWAATERFASVSDKGIDKEANFVLSTRSFTIYIRLDKYFVAVCFWKSVFRCRNDYGTYWLLTVIGILHKLIPLVAELKRHQHFAKPLPIPLCVVQWERRTRSQVVLV